MEESIKNPRKGGSFGSVSLHKTRDTDDGIVRLVVTGSSIINTRSGIPNAIRAGDSRGKDRFGSELFPFTGPDNYTSASAPPPVEERTDPYPLSGTELMAFFGDDGTTDLTNGLLPVSMWRFTSSLGAEDIIANNDLSATNVTITSSISLGSGTLDVALFTDGTEGYYRALTSSLFDSNLTSVTVFTVQRILSNPATTRAIWGKRDAVSPFNGFQQRAYSTVTLQVASFKGGTDIINSTDTSYGDGSGFAMFSGLEYAGSTHLVQFTDREVRKDSGIVLEQTNTSSFSIGANGTLKTPHMEIAFAAVFTGSAAEQLFTQGHMNNFTASIGM